METTTNREGNMTADYIISTYTEAKAELVKAIEAEDAAKFKYQKREAWEAQEFWLSKVGNMVAAAKKFNVSLPA